MLPASDYYGSAQAALPVEGGPTYVQVCVGGVSPWWSFTDRRLRLSQPQPPCQAVGSHKEGIVAGDLADSFLGLTAKLSGLIATPRSNAVP
jgi:hypothetical protein